jgi:hypothetical protein
MQPTNEKQAAWRKAMNLFGKKDMIFLETGRIRNPQWKRTDGDSTNFFTLIDDIGKLYSIDNDSENFSGFSTSEEYCKSSLSEDQLKKIVFINGHSVDIIKNIDQKFDGVLLDSADDAQLIYEELLAVLHKLKDEALIIVDDVTPPANKGVMVRKFLEKHNIEYTIHDADPCGCLHFILSREKIDKMIQG